jgi:hypothetical protein
MKTKYRKSKPATPANPKASAELRSKELLGCVKIELEMITSRLGVLRKKCNHGNECRIGFEIGQTQRTIENTVSLIDVYRIGKKLPTLASMRGIFKRKQPNAPDQGRRASDSQTL